MTLDEHSPVEQRVFRVLEGFTDAFSELRAPAHLVEVLEDDKYLKGSELGQKPERFVEDNLIWGILNALGYDYLPRPHGYPRWDTSTPDFAITNFSFDFEFSTLGEVKTPNKFEYAKNNVVDYVHSDLEKHTIAFATDGLTWKVYFRNRKDDRVYFISEAYLQDSLKPLVKRYMENEEYNSHQLRKKMTGVEDISKPIVEEYVRDKVEHESWEG